MVSDSCDDGEDCGCLTGLLGAEVLQRISSRVGVEQQDGKTEISMRGNHCVFLERRPGNKRGKSRLNDMLVRGRCRSKSLKSP